VKLKIQEQEDIGSSENSVEYQSNNELLHMLYHKDRKFEQSFNVLIKIKSPKVFMFFEGFYDQ
jgi:hypothetical protein